ncbi:MAG: trehalose-phosphatase, partial [Proteobacteria bacterium]
ATQGAVALISSRSLESLESMGLPGNVNVAGLYGLQARAFDGTSVIRMPENYNRVRGATADLRELTRDHPELHLEDKGLAVSVRCPGPAGLTRMVLMHMQDAVLRLGPAYHLVARNNVVEIKPRKANKGNAIRDYLVNPPFRGRDPVFIGDDISDEDAFGVVNDLRGFTVRVGNVRRGMTRARCALPSVSALLDWLEQLLRDNGAETGRA